MAISSAPIERPRLRGCLHLGAAVVSLAGLVWLLVAAPTSRSLAVGAVYGLTAVALYATSATYHMFAGSDRARSRMQRLDHAMIYVLIAGTYTPIAVLAVPNPWRWPSLALMWSGAIAGVVLGLQHPRFRRSAAALYIVLGWAGLMALPGLLDRPGLLLLVAIGGLTYTVGAALFAAGWPRRSARWFGYHELWHALGIAAGAVLFAANLGLVRGG